MKLTAVHLRKIIKEELESVRQALGNPTRFLHGEDPEDSEGAMAQSKLHSMGQMTEELCSILQTNDQLPGWVQDHISVAHENLQQVHGYITGRADEQGQAPAIALSVESRRRR